MGSAQQQARGGLASPQWVGMMALREAICGGALPREVRGRARLSAERASTPTGATGE